MTVQQVADRLVALCREGKNEQALDELYSDDIVSTEAAGSPEMPAEMKGLEAIRAKTAWWYDTFQWNGGSVEGPLVADEHFTVKFDMDTTNKKTGERVQMSEIAVYQVKGGKIVAERFFYTNG